VRRVYGLCIVLSLIGLSGIYYSAEYMTPEKINISSVETGMTGEVVTVTGSVGDPYFNNGTFMMTLEDDTDSIPVIMFDADRSFLADERVAVEGTVTLYEGETEIVADRITQK
jgi:DNA/RNA endonuclease YhcR with UshA esterase domain